MSNNAYECRYIFNDELSETELISLIQTNFTNSIKKITVTNITELYDILKSNKISRQTKWHPISERLYPDNNGLFTTLFSTQTD